MFRSELGIFSTYIWSCNKSIITSAEIKGSRAKEAYSASNSCSVIHYAS